MKKATWTFWHLNKNPAAISKSKIQNPNHLPSKQRSDSVVREKYCMWRECTIIKWHRIALSAFSRTDIEKPWPLGAGKQSYPAEFIVRSVIMTHFSFGSCIRDRRTDRQSLMNALNHSYLLPLLPKLTGGILLLLGTCFFKWTNQHQAWNMLIWLVSCGALYFSQNKIASYLFIWQKSKI